MARFWNKQKYLKLLRLFCDVGAVLFWVWLLFPWLVYLAGKTKGVDVGYSYHFTISPVLVLAVAFSLGDFVIGYFLMKKAENREKVPRVHKKRRHKK